MGKSTGNGMTMTAGPYLLESCSLLAGHEATVGWWKNTLAVDSNIEEAVASCISLHSYAIASSSCFDGKKPAGGLLTHKYIEEYITCKEWPIKIEPRIKVKCKYIVSPDR